MMDEMNRRTLLKVGVAGLAGLALGCGDSSQDRKWRSLGPLVGMDTYVEHQKFTRQEERWIREASIEHFNAFGSSNFVYQTLAQQGTNLAYTARGASMYYGSLPTKDTRRVFFHKDDRIDGPHMNGVLGYIDQIDFDVHVVADEGDGKFTTPFLYTALIRSFGTHDNWHDSGPLQYNGNLVGPDFWKQVSDNQEGVNKRIKALPRRP